MSETTLPPSDAIPGRCGAHGRRKMAPCSNWPVHGSRRCRMHGGKGSGAPRGEAHGRFKHGLSAKPLDADVDARARRLKRTSGALTDSLLRKVATVDAVLDRFIVANPDGPRDHDTTAAFNATVTTAKGLYAAHAAMVESAKVDAPSVAPIFQIATMSGSGAPFTVRGVDGQAALAVQLSDGRTLVQCPDLAWRVSVEQTDENGVARYLLTDGGGK